MGMLGIERLCTLLKVKEAAGVKARIQIQACLPVHQLPSGEIMAYLYIRQQCNQLFSLTSLVIKESSFLPITGSYKYHSQPKQVRYIGMHIWISKE